MKSLALTLLCLGLSCMSVSAQSTKKSLGSVLSSVLGSSSTSSTVSNIVGSVLGTNKPSESDLVGNWKYSQPGVAFTSSNVLAKAGGEVAATKVKSKLSSTYKTIGMKSSNTYFNLKEDKTFSGKIGGTPLKGTWTYDSSSQKLNLKTLLFTIPCYAQKTSSGMSFLFESKKLLTLLQTVASLSGNSTLSTIGSLSKNYSGVRMGFEMGK